MGRKNILLDEFKDGQRRQLTYELEMKQVVGRGRQAGRQPGR